MRVAPHIIALFLCLSGLPSLVSCNDHDAQRAQLQALVDQQRNELSALNERMTRMATEVKGVDTRLGAVESVTSCVDRRIKAMQAWSRHRPKWGRCREMSFGKCKSTGLKPNSITPYRSRLRTVFNLINAANFKAAAIALDKLKFPVPTVDRWYEKENITKEGWLEMRAKAEAMTRSYLVECGGVATAAQPGETHRLDKESRSDVENMGAEAP